MEDADDNILRSDVDKYGGAQAGLWGCEVSLDWEVRASSEHSMTGRRTDFRFAVAAIASSPVFSLAKKFEGIQILLLDEHRKTRRCKTARFVSALCGQDKRAIRTWVDRVHRLRSVTVPPPPVESRVFIAKDSVHITRLECRPPPN